MDNTVNTIIESSVFTKILANNWQDFVDCPKRMKTLGPFFESHFSKHKSGYIFDAALGIGCDSIFLSKKNYHIISNEIDDTLIQHAESKANISGIKLHITQQDWRELEYPYNYNFFEGIFLVGNSICLFDNISDIRISLKNFYSSLKHGGTLIIDERNFQYILDKKDDILGGNFKYSNKYVYCGLDVKGVPIKISDKSVVFGYFRNNILLGHLQMYPFKKDQLMNLLFEVGFNNVKRFSDYKEGYDATADFFTYVATK